MALYLKVKRRKNVEAAPTASAFIDRALLAIKIPNQSFLLSSLQYNCILERKARQQNHFGLLSVRLRHCFTQQVSPGLIEAAFCERRVTARGSPCVSRWHGDAAQNAKTMRAVVTRSVRLYADYNAPSKKQQYLNEQTQTAKTIHIILYKNSFFENLKTWKTGRLIQRPLNFLFFHFFVTCVFFVVVAA